MSTTVPRARAGERDRRRSDAINLPCRPAETRTRGTGVERVAHLYTSAKAKTKLSGKPSANNADAAGRSPRGRTCPCAPRSIASKSLRPPWSQLSPKAGFGLPPVRRCSLLRGLWPDRQRVSLMIDRWCVKRRGQRFSCSALYNLKNNFVITRSCIGFLLIHARGRLGPLPAKSGQCRERRQAVTGSWAPITFACSFWAPL